MENTQEPKIVEYVAMGDGVYEMFDDGREVQIMFNCSPAGRAEELAAALNKKLLGG